MSLPSWMHCKFVAGALHDHARCRWWQYAIVAASFVWCDTHYRIGLNLSNSLPDAVYLVMLNTQPTAIGDLVAFEWQRDQFYRRDMTFIKRVAGLPGQRVALHGRAVFIDDQLVGYAKPYSSRGIPLEPIPPGVIPAGYLYAAAPHPDSLDSRYSVTGLIAANRIVGRAYALF